VDRKDLQALARTRLAEAKSLLAAGHADGAYYLAGYAIECALKACIAKRTRRHEFPDKKTVDSSYTHNLKELVRVANLEGLRAARVKSDSIFRVNWETAQDWSEQSRYTRFTETAARKLLDAVADRRHGLLAWIAQYW
jgi:hypothetical protein